MTRSTGRSLIRARQPGVTRLTPHNASGRWIIPRGGARPQPPEILPASGAVTVGTEVTMTSPQGLPIYFTADETGIPGDYKLYEGPVAVLGNTTLRAVCKYPGGMPSSIVERVYTISATADRVRWEFNNTLDGWRASSTGTSVLTPQADRVRVVTTNGGPLIFRDIVTSGQTGLIWRYVEVQYVVRASTVNDTNVRVSWSNINHGILDQFSVLITQAKVLDTVYTHTFDMWSSAEAADWKATDLASVAFRIYSTNGNVTWEVLYIEARKEGFPV